MEVKSNVRQRRMDRMKQIIASEQGEHRSDAKLAQSGGNRIRGQAQANRGWTRDNEYGKTDRERTFREEEPPRIDFGREDPEYVWKRQERERWSSFERVPGPAPEGWMESGRLKPPTVRQIWIKLGISAVLFAGIWGMFRIDHPMADRGRQWVKTSLTEDYDFSAMAAWYEREFGGLPAFLPSLRAKSDPEAQKASSPSLQRLYSPVRGKIVGAATDGDPGVTIRTEPEAAVASLDTGRVVSVSTGTDKATVVVIQHASGLQSIYGWLKGTSLKTNDWVKGGETIGSVTTDAAGGAGKLYVAVKKENQYVNPAEVVSFD